MILAGLIRSAAADTLTSVELNGSPATLAGKLAEVVATFQESVEFDSENTTPSKRLQQLVPSCDKVAFGTLIAITVEIDALRRGCPWLGRWLDGLERGGEG